MNTISADDIRRISTQLDAFYTAYRSSIYYSEVCSSITIQQNRSQFWKFQKYLLLYSLVINWCEVFGANTHNNHWKEITFEDKEFITQLYERSNFDYGSWSEYRRYVEDIKFSYLVEPDLYHHDKCDINLYGIDASLNITHQWLYDLITENEDILPEDLISRWPIKERTFSQDIRHEFRALFGQEASSQIAQAI